MEQVPAYAEKIEKTITIFAQPAEVWACLTDPVLMSQWMGPAEMNIQVDTDWKVDSLILIKGFHHIAFENKGIVLAFEPERQLQYSYLSSISGLADKEEHYTKTGFQLTPEGAYTLLHLELENFPTETIYRHVNFYWQGTLVLLKKYIEQRNWKN